MSELLRIRELVAEKLGLLEQDLAEDMLLSELNWDSLDFLELAVALEQEFDIMLPDARLQTCRTIGEVEEIITLVLRE